MNFPIDLPPDYLQRAKGLKVFAEDIEEQFVRGGGKGGQKVNKTASCVLLKHGPTGIEVRCQKHREQSKNRISAYKLLIRKIETKVMGRKSQRALKIYKLRKQKKRRSKRAKEKMVESKRRRGDIKGSRKNVDSSS